MSHEIEKDWTTASGLRAVVLVCIYDGRKSHRCGYVGLPPSSPLFGVAYNQEIDVPQQLADKQTIGSKSPILAFTACVIDGEASDRVRRSPDILLDVHGGLTYNTSDANDNKYPVESNLWWYGFDCHHCDDANIEPHPTYSFNRGGHVWSLEEVASECENLARQIAELEKILPTPRLEVPQTGTLPAHTHSPTGQPAPKTQPTNNKTTQR
jgi:hypothetical protein